MSLVDRCHLVPRDLKWQNFSSFQMAKFFLSFLESFNNGVFWCFSVSYAEYIARTDLAIAQLKPWRSKIQLKAFSSRVRFQIRIDDLRGSVVKGEAKIDEILGFYNLATDALLNQYSKGIHILQKHNEPLKRSYNQKWKCLDLCKFKNFLSEKYPFRLKLNNLH